MAIKTPRGHYLGAHPSKPDPRDFGIPFHLLFRPRGPFPAEIILPGIIGPTKDQGAQGSCTGHGATSQGERLYRFWGGGAYRNVRFSPAFHYYLERQEEGTLGDGDCGAQVATSLKIAQNGGYGFCPEEFMPYNENDYMTPPTPTALAAAKRYPGGSWHSIGNNIANIKSCVASRYSGVLGIAVYESFEDSETERTGLVPVPNREREELLGWHEVHSLLATNDSIKCPGAKHPGAVLTQNSWGNQWGIRCPYPSMSGDGGFCWIPYEFLADPALTSDVRMQHLGGPWK